MGDVGAECYHFAPTFLELWGDCLGYLLGGVGVNVIHAFLDGIEQRRLISVVTGAGRRFLSK